MLSQAFSSVSSKQSMCPSQCFDNGKQRFISHEKNPGLQLGLAGPNIKQNKWYY